MHRTNWSTASFYNSSSRTITNIDSVFEVAGKSIQCTGNALEMVKGSNTLPGSATFTSILLALDDCELLFIAPPGESFIVVKRERTIK